jgi:Cu(I)/Ag(I) efflux system membrane fusion protein
MRKRPIIVASAIIAALAAGYALYSLGVTHGERAAGPRAGIGLRPGDLDPATGRQVLYWQDPMVPGRRFDAPGRSPFMDMQLVPVYADAGADPGAVTVSPRLQQNLGLRTAEVTRASFAVTIAAAGNVAFNERGEVLVQARAAGYVERLSVRAQFDRVTAGQPLAEIYVPDWVAAQREFLSVLRLRGTDLEHLGAAARERMRQAGMTEEQIRRVEQRGEVDARLTITAPIAGVVVELGAREGLTVAPGSLLFKLNSLDTVWVNAAVPEREAAQLAPGAAIEARTVALPGRVWQGTVQAVLPAVDAATRTVTVRVEIDNADGALKPGMFASLTLAGPSTEALSVPTEALIRTGLRTVAIVVEPSGGFRPVDVVTGAESGDRTEIVSGLAAGQRIVASGQFLIDSEASFRAATERLDAGAVGPRP